MIGAGVGIREKMNPFSSLRDHRSIQKGTSAMTTVAENTQQKTDTAKRWKEANPGLSWCSQEYREDEEKIYISKELLNSIAYRSLSRCALLIYQDFMAKRIMIKIKRDKTKVWTIHNNGEIVYPYHEAVDKGFTRKQFRNAIDELQQKGLIDIKHLGKGGRKPAEGSTGDASRYWIDDRWINYGTVNFNPARNPRNKDTRKSRGWSLINSDPDRKKAIEQRRKEVLKKKVECRKEHSLRPNQCRKEHSLRENYQIIKFGQIK